MKALVPLFALLAAPAVAQDRPVYFTADQWSVETVGRACTLANTPRDGSNPLSITYDAATGEVALTAETDEIGTALDDSGSIRLNIVFLDNGRTKYDDQWGGRAFTYTREGDVARFSTRFAGEKNVRQILADLAASKDVGLLHQGKAVMSTNLAQAGVSIDKLQECARRAVAAN